MKNDFLNKNRFLMTELYELTMANGLFMSGKNDEIAYFDVFFRKGPDKAALQFLQVCQELLILLKTSLLPSLIWNIFLHSDFVTSLSIIFVISNSNVISGQYPREHRFFLTSL